MSKNCTCGFSKETADEIGHFKDCPKYKNWKRKNKMISGNEKMIKVK